MTRIQRFISFIIVIIIIALRFVTSLKAPVCTGGTLSRPKSMTTFAVRLL